MVDFKLRFKDPDGDWTCIVRTDRELITKREFKRAIYDAGKRLMEDEDYCDFDPVELFDELCEYNGWEWEDYDDDEVEVDYDLWDENNNLEGE